MIAHLDGRVCSVAPDGAVIDVGGVGLLVQCTPGTLAGLRPGERARVATSLVVREDALTLFGFAGEDERNTFELLQTASGVGPRLALAMLAVFSPDALRRAIAAEDLTALMTVPGVGRKGAQRIVLELAGRLGSPGELPSGEAGGPASSRRAAPWRDQVRAGLVNLGWQARDADLAIAAVEPELLGASTGSAATGSAKGPRVAVLGTGIMGSAMARNLARAGLDTTVWDRTAAAAAPLAAAGAQVAESAVEAVTGADVVITMLPDGDAVSAVMFERTVDALADGAAWAQMGTIGVPATSEIADRLARLRPGVLFVDAPVSGSKGPAETGELLVLASGPPAAVPVLTPVFEVIGRKTVWLGEAGAGSRMKLAVNAYMSVFIEGVAEALELVDRLGIDPGKLDDVIEGGPLDAPIADAKLHKMERGDLAPEFPLEWALKDVDLDRKSVV